jgi:hypothetical protein
MKNLAIKGVVAASVAVTIALLAACDDATMELFSKPAVTQIEMADGQVALAAPRGYCVDTARTKHAADQSFALIARCDRLGQRSNTTHTEPLAVIAISVIPQPKGTGPMTDAKLEAAQEQGTVDRRHNRPDIAMIRVTNTADRAHAGSHLWRGAFRVNGQIVGATLYAPDGSPALGNAGADLLENFARATRKATAAAIKAIAESQTGETSP